MMLSYATVIELWSTRVLGASP